MQATAKVLKASISDQHMIARLGGDEFGILCVNTTEVEAEKIRQHIDNALSRANIRAALGMAMRDPTKGLLDAIKQADLNMYQDKKEKLGVMPTPQD
ncbi:diguanylate cyclase (GGDEF) domain-containing protein [Acinetobacter marinus]|uniref:diguanylate cyclase n=1 Tax=Acinetobacter marinus TaxID=281375 RepID=A0A1G6J6T9_9GAMM|nr:diguanylate cyclase (GGDEF) domain-containing protein [Acinetobacter marinus]